MEQSISSQKCLRVGVLGIIGSFAEHVNQTRRAFQQLNGEKSSEFADLSLEVDVVRTPDKVNGDLDGLIIPGGETTVLSSFLSVRNFADVIKKWACKPEKFMWGTCAGLIVMSNHVENGGRKPPVTIGGVDITCLRNGYGRQKESHVVELQLNNEELKNALKCSEYSVDKFSGVFIRAPAILSVDSTEVEVLCTRAKFEAKNDSIQVFDEREPVGVAHGNKMATTFHPELADDTRWHAFFLTQVLKRKRKD